MTGTCAVFAMGGSAGPGSPFAGTVRATLAERDRPPGIHVFAPPRHPVARHFDEATGKAIYLVGRATHPSLAGGDLLRWCGERVGGNDGVAFAELLGPFVVVIDDRRAGRVSFIADAMGLLPWFVGRHEGCLVAGTDVLGICDAGLSAGEVDYDSVASWLNYSFVCTGGSIVRDYRRIKPGAVSTFDPAGRLIDERPYAPLRFAREILPPEELVEELLRRVHASFDRLTRGVDEVNLPLSGGYDSRLLCALAAEHGRPRVNLTVVESTPEEAHVASRVAKAVGMPLRVMPVGPSRIDLFDDPLYFLPEGFPTARNLTNAVARLRPGMPVLSGFMGDVLMRGPINAGMKAFLAMDEQGLGDDALARAAHDRCRLKTNKLHLLRDGIGARAADRATAAMRAVVRDGRSAGRPLTYVNLYQRHRVYFACIFLSHLDVADALLPFPSWDLVRYHTGHHGSFAADTYDRLFERFFPKLAGIPHESRVKLPPSPRNGNRTGRPTRHLRRWGSELLRGVPGKWRSTAITPHKLLRRLPGALWVDGRHADEIGYLHRIHAFEERLQRANVVLDWSQL